MKRILPLLPALFIMIAGCSGAKIQQEREHCDANTDKILGPVLGQIKTLTEQKADVEAQLKAAQEHVDSLTQSNAQLSETLAGKKGQAQKRIKDLIAQKDELARRLGEAHKSAIALQRAQKNSGEKAAGLEERLAQNEADRRKAESAKADRASRARAAMDAVAAAVAAQAQAGQASLAQSQDSFSLTLSNDLLFAPKSAKLTDAGSQSLDRLGAAVGRLEPLQVRVEAHSDNAPIEKGLLGGYSSHWEQTAARAVAVARYLHEKSGLDPHRLEADARGEFAPAQANDTPEGRKANRRLVLVFALPAAEPAPMTDPAPAAPQAPQAR